VHPGDLVKAGDALVRGPLVPQDILRVSGPEEVQQYLLHEIQNVYRAQRVEIDDKHIEIVILAQMMRKVQIDEPGDSDFLPGAVVDKFRFRSDQHAKLHEGEEEARRGLAAAPGRDEGQSLQVGLVHLGRLLPGDDQGADRGRTGRSQGPADRPQGERHPRAPRPDRHRLLGLPAHAGPQEHRPAGCGRPSCSPRRRAQAGPTIVLEGEEASSEPGERCATGS
jgi:hypothetical protein